ncbi:hypothetical protein LB505_000482 [Fusarium chuoi]|nr:hypothetical protein LB505_000482 [Fusarium chuoi]
MCHCQGSAECSKWSPFLSAAREELSPKAKPGSPKAIVSWPTAISRSSRRCLSRIRTKIPSICRSRSRPYRKPYVNQGAGYSN